ncbi:MAG: DUF1003 domain-containing protein [Bacteroidota bacterium]|nr:DUF1003 domain-containing protein [Bacteroidota bacterium]
MKELIFPKIYKHEHEPIKNVNEVIEESSTYGQRVVDNVVSVVGSWKFIIIQSCILTAWVVLNVVAFISHWDPYPFILMNLALSLQAAYTAPIIMMSQNRQSYRDRIDAHLDYKINQKAEEENRVIIEHLEAQNLALTEILKNVINNSNNNKE